jgi:hypothetical protein
MHVIGGILLIVLVYWIVSRLTGSRGVGTGAAAVTGVALLMLNSGHRHRDHDRLT